MNDLQDRIRGSVIGGAAGDALGYAVEFQSEDDILNKYGRNGITNYHIDKQKGKALISDDTQMSLFTIAAIVFGMGRYYLRGISAYTRFYANMTYQDWLLTQEMSYDRAISSVIDEFPRYPDGFISTILSDTPELFECRAPGTTCLSALRTRREERKQNKQTDNFIESKINDSKGCGGIMRVAPIGLFYDMMDINKTDIEGAQCAAITHGHPLGYMSAAVLVHIINRIVYPKNKMALKEIVLEACGTVAELFAGEDFLTELIDIIELAVELSENKDSDIDNIHRLGEGWVAEETLAIAVYCSLKYQNDFSKAIIAAVNHKGDSDSTGAVTGNIVGAMRGYELIEQKWKTDLEISDKILETADLLYYAHTGELWKDIKY